MDPMTARDRVRAELVGIRSITNDHGIELVRDQVIPVRRDYECPLPARILAHVSAGVLEPVLPLWCVVSAGPGGLDLVFDEVAGRFGLATHHKDGRGVVCGWCPTLLDAFRGM
jgi:hypothetical protein